MLVNRASPSSRSTTVTGFLGPNGAGKTTTMRVILGLDAPTSGRALVAGRRYDGLIRPLREVGSLLGLALGSIIRHTPGGIIATLALIVLPSILSLLPAPWSGRIGRFTLLDAARQVSALHPATNLFAPGWSLLVLLAWPAAALAVAAVLITRRDA